MIDEHQRGLATVEPVPERPALGRDALPARARLLERRCLAGDRPQRHANLLLRRQDEALQLKDQAEIISPGAGGRLHPMMFQIWRQLVGM
jgi:hypothetical protein